MKKIILITALILMIPAMCLANYKITYVEYFTPNKPGPLHQRINTIIIREYYGYPVLHSVVQYTDINGNKGAVRSPYIKIEEVKKED